MFMDQDVSEVAAVTDMTTGGKSRVSMTRQCS
jgi:hypothetical protein